MAPYRQALDALIYAMPLYIVRLTDAQPPRNIASIILWRRRLSERLIAVSPSYGARLFRRLASP